MVAITLNLLATLTTLSLSTLTSASPTAKNLNTRQEVDFYDTDFYLKTRVTSGDITKDGLFVVAWHAYAGGNDVALMANSTDAPSSLGFLNGTYVQFDLEENQVFPWGLELDNLDGHFYWDNWNAVGINGGYGDEANNGTTIGFFFDGDCLTADYDDFGGWLACDWARQVPQLFWYGSYVNVSSGNIPSSCAVVDLVGVPDGLLYSLSDS